MWYWHAHVGQRTTWNYFHVFWLLKNAPEMGWTIKLGNGTKTHTLLLNDALRQGFNFLIDSEKLTLDVPVNATGVTQYVVGVETLLYRHHGNGQCP